MQLIFGEDRPLTPEEKAKAEQREAKIQREASPVILARTARWSDHRMLPDKSLPLAIRPQPTHFDNVLADWHVGYLNASREFEAPYELQQDLKQQVPQSILRDIYRPTRASTQVELVVHDFELDPGGRKAWAATKEGLVREPIPSIALSSEVFEREQRRRRRFLSRAWKPYLSDSAPRFHTPQDVQEIDNGATLDDDDDG